MLNFGLLNNRRSLPNRDTLLAYYKKTVTDGRLTAYLPAANHTTQQVKSSGFLGAGSSPCPGLLVTDTITASGDAPTCTVNGTLTFPGPDCWDIDVFRDGVRWASWKGINVGQATELDASGNGHHLTGLVGTTITERLDGSGTNYVNENGFSLPGGVLYRISSTGAVTTGALTIDAPTTAVADYSGTDADMSAVYSSGGLSPAIKGSRIAKNLLLESEFTNGKADLNSTTANVTVTSLAGFVNALLFPESATFRSAFKQLTTVTGYVYRFSCFVKMADDSVPRIGVSTTDVNSDLMLSIDANITTVANIPELQPDGTYKCSAVRTTTAGAANRNFGVIAYPTNSNKAFTVTGYQAEIITGRPRLMPFEYIKTTSATKSVLHDTVQYNKLNKSVAIGDSYTATGTYITHLGQIIGITGMVKSGISGQTLADLDTRFATDVVAGAPIAVLIMGGVNDVINTARTLADMQASLNSMLAKADAASIHPIICTIPPFGNYSGWTADKQSRAEAYSAWVRTLDRDKIDLYEILRDPGTINILAAYDSSDGLHSNSAGHLAIAAGIAILSPNQSVTLQPYTTVDGNKIFDTHLPSRRSTAYSIGDKISAVCSDSIKRWFTCTTGGTTSADAVTFPDNSAPVSDGDVVWTGAASNYHTIDGVVSIPGETNIADTLTDTGLSGRDEISIKFIPNLADTEQWLLSDGTNGIYISALNKIVYSGGGSAILTSSGSVALNEINTLVIDHTPTGTTMILNGATDTDETVTAAIGWGETIFIGSKTDGVGVFNGTIFDFAKAESTPVVVPGPLGIDGAFDGTAFPVGNFQAPLGRDFQLIPEFTGNASVDLAALVPTAKIRIGPRGMTVRSVDGSAEGQARDDRVVGA